MSDFLKESCNDSVMKETRSSFILVEEQISSATRYLKALENLAKTIHIFFVDRLNKIILL